MAGKIPRDGKARTILIAAAGVLLVGGALAWFSWQRASDGSGTVSPPSSTVGARAPTADGATDQRATQVYDDLLKKNNAKAAAEAARDGGSAIPVIRTGVEQDTGMQGKSTAVPPHPVVAVQPVSQQQMDERYKNALTERQREIKDRQAAMGQQLALLQKAWNISPHTQMVAPEVKSGPAMASAPTSAGSGLAGVTAAVSAAPLIQAGESVVATLDTPVDTDNPLPVYRATIVQDGPLHGAVVLGTVQANTQNHWASGVQLTFHQISLPGAGVQTINAFAINAEDAGALKGQVDRHVWSRYAAAFGGAFLQGVGQGLMAGGRDQQVITSTNGYAVQSNAFSNKQLVMLGAANVGQVAATAMQANINRPPTIQIPGGTTIAIFFAADLPASPITK